LSEHDEGPGPGAHDDDRETDQQGDIHEAASLPTARRRPRVWPWVVGLVVIAAIVASFMVPTPYYVNGPGLVRATQPLITVKDHESYTSDGEVLFRTVSQRRATPFLLLQAWFDETVDSVPEDVAVPTGNREQERRVEQAQMDRSKLTSLEVAFEAIGTPITITGTGAFINTVAEGFPSENVLEPGDVITAVDGVPVSVASDVRPHLETKAVGAHVVLAVRKKGADRSVDVDVELGRSEDDDSHGYLGVELSTADEDVELPFDVELDSGSVIGPSAGLAWTLGVIDRLTPGDLTHGKRVAVTGTIDRDGNVGAIGGIAQKVAGAMDAGATLFLYPSTTKKADVARMKALAGDAIELRAVATVDDALHELDPGGLGAA